MRMADSSRPLLNLAIFIIIFLISGCVQSENNTQEKPGASREDIFVDIVAACSGVTPLSSKSFVKTAYDDKYKSEVCIDIRYRFKKLQVVKMRVQHLERFDTYVVYLYFDKSQLNRLNRFINRVMGTRIYWLRRGEVLEHSVWSVFTTQLEAPKFAMSVASRREGLELINKFRSDPPTRIGSGSGAML